MQINSNIRVCTALYDFDIYGGTVGTINLRTYLKPRTLILSAAYFRVRTFTSGGAATISFGLNGISTQALSGAALYSSIVPNTSTTISTNIGRIPTTGTFITMTILNAALTDGAIVINVITTEQDI